MTKTQATMARLPPARHDGGLFGVHLVCTFGRRSPKTAFPTRVEGLEPTTFGSVDRCSIQLSYTRMGPMVAPRRFLWCRK